MPTPPSQDNQLFISRPDLSKTQHVYEKHLKSMEELRWRCANEPRVRRQGKATAYYGKAIIDGIILHGVSTLPPRPLVEEKHKSYLHWVGIGFGVDCHTDEELICHTSETFFGPAKRNSGFTSKLATSYPINCQPIDDGLKAAAAATVGVASDLISKIHQSEQEQEQGLEPVLVLPTGKVAQVINALTNLTASPSPNTTQGVAGARR